MNIIQEIAGKANNTFSSIDTALPLDGITDITGSLDLESGFGGLISSVSGAIDTDSLSMNLPAFPETGEQFGIIDTITSKFNSLGKGDLLKGLGSGGGLVSIDAPAFDISSGLNGIIAGMLPVAVGINSVDNLPDSVDVDGLQRIIIDIKNAGQKIPIRLFHILINTYNSFIDIVTNPETLLDLALRSIEEIWIKQLQSVELSIPAFTLDMCSDILVKNDFIRRYSTLLTELTILDPMDTPRMTNLVSSINKDFVPVFKKLKHGERTLNCMLTDSVTELDKVLNDITAFSIGEGVILDNLLAPVSDGIRKMADAVTPPVTAIGDAAGTIKTFLEDVGTKATDAVNTISTTISSNFDTLNSYMPSILETFDKIETGVTGFLEKIDTVAMMEPVKNGCATVGTKLSDFFSKIEEVKLKLNIIINNLDKTIDEQYYEKLGMIKGKIEELLGEITGVLEKPEVQDILKQVKDGIQLFKDQMDEVSLVTVFKLVDTKTKDVEGKIKSIDTSKLGTPQKMALRVVVQFINQIKIEDFVKPELMNLFKEIQGPLLNIAGELEKYYGMLESMIFDIEPGSIVSKYIEESEPFKMMISTLSSVKPSDLLGILKELNEELVGIVDILDPCKIIDLIQEGYNKIAGILDRISPLKILDPITGGVDTAYTVLQGIKNKEIPSIMSDIRDMVSLESLLAGAGLQGISDNDLWNTLIYYCGGKFLDEIEKSVGDLGQKLIEGIDTTLDVSDIMAELTTVKKGISRQLAYRGADCMSVMNGITGYFDDNADTFTAIENTWLDLKIKFGTWPEFVSLLDTINPKVLRDVSTNVGKLVEQGENTINTSLYNVNTLLGSQTTALNALAGDTFNGSVSDIITVQFIDPVKKRITELKQVFTPIEAAITAIQEITVVLEEMPAKIDTAVGGLLLTLEDTITGFIDMFCTGLTEFKDTVTTIVTSCNDKLHEMVRTFNPYWILNSLATGDLVDVVKAEYKNIYSALLNENNPLTQLLLERLPQEADALSHVLNTSSKTKKDILAAFVTLFNAALELEEVCSVDIVSVVQQSLKDRMLAGEQELAELTDVKIMELSEEEKKALNEALKAPLDKIHKSKVLLKLIMEAKIAYDSDKKEEDRYRLNRLLMEAYYPQLIGFSLQSVFGYMKMQIAGLYPEDTVKKLDEIYEKIIDKIKQLPDELIAQPLDQEFNKLETLFKDTFDFSGLFKIFTKAIDELDEELEEGFDIISKSYHRMLTTIEQRLA